MTDRQPFIYPGEIHPKDENRYRDNRTSRQKKRDRKLILVGLLFPLILFVLLGSRWYYVTISIRRLIQQFWKNFREVTAVAARWVKIHRMKALVLGLNPFFLPRLLKSQNPFSLRMMWPDGFFQTYEWKFIINKGNQTYISKRASRTRSSKMGRAEVFAAAEPDFELLSIDRA